LRKLGGCGHPRSRLLIANLNKQEFIIALKENQQIFRVDLDEKITTDLAGYYELVEKWNPRLHLVAPCSAEEFAVRHVLESLAILEFLPENAELIDVGTGAGLPSIPCLLARADLRGTLIESNTKKAVFLREALSKLNLQTRGEVLNSRFEQTAAPAGFVTSRALDKFVEKLPEIAHWARRCEKLLLFGGEKVRDKLTELGLDFATKLIPDSERRFVFVVEPKT
ncbi:MAG TPA: 16S rRNA (guanine(527)-N(7))-methyltransferase RsmG, partial [Pyrinomonadaceae bacterium]